MLFRSGHAIVTALQTHTEPVQKITIVPRTMGALGFVMQTPEEEKYLQTKEELEEKVISLLAGRASEEIFFNTITTGASNDIEKATDIVRAMITQFGMNEQFGLVMLSKQQGKYLNGEKTLICSEGMAEKIDTAVIDSMNSFYLKAKELLTNNQEIIHKLAAYLIENETITGDQFMKIFNEGVAV